MSFDPSKPDANESPDQFPAQAQANWSRLQTIISANHVFNFGADSSDGKHTTIEMPEQSGTITAASNEIVMYAEEAQSQAQVTLAREGGSTKLHMTASDVTDTTAQSATGYTCLPGALLLQWGTKTVSAKSSAIVTFPKAYNAAAGSVYSINTTEKSTSTGSDANGNVETVTSTTFTIYNSSSSSRDFYWMAIGKA